MSSRKYLLLVVALLLLLVPGLFACDEEPSGGGDEQPVDGDDPVEDGDETDEDGDDQTEGPIEADTLNGVWGVTFSIAYTCLLPVFERRVQFILTGVGRLIFDQDGTTLNFTEEICDFSMNVVEVKEVPFIVIFPQNEIDAVPIEPRLAQLDGLEIGTRVKTTPALDIYGADAARFDDPGADALPEESDDPRVVNFGDDIPGVTARLGGMFNGMEVYVVLRMMRDMDGVLLSPDLIAGSIDSRVEMRTIGASNPIVRLQLDLEPHPEPDLNRFEMVRLDREMNCAEIYEAQEELFSYDPFDYATPFTYDR